jgi:TRAP-type C4-dicarboxylate transport system permease large subunit
MVASVATSVGFDEIHFGILLILNAMLGNITPPVGNVLMAVVSLEGLDFSKTCKALAAPLLVLVGVLILLILCPPLCTWLPNTIA